MTVFLLVVITAMAVSVASRSQTAPRPTDEFDCVREPPRPSQFYPQYHIFRLSDDPGLPSPPGVSGGVCKYIGSNGECFRHSGTYNEAECREKFGDYRYNAWVRKQRYNDYANYISDISQGP